MKKVLKKWGLNMKDYFTNNEIDDLLFTSYLIERNTELVDEWGARGNLTKEEAKYLRTAVTYTKKFLTATMERMPMKQVEKFTLRTIRAIHEPVRIVDKWTYDRIFGKMEKEFEVVKMPRGEFDYLARQLIARCCVQCNQSFKPDRRRKAGWPVHHDLRVQRPLLRRRLQPRAGGRSHRRSAGCIGGGGRFPAAGARRGRKVQGRPLQRASSPGTPLQNGQAHHPLRQEDPHQLRRGAALR